MTNNELHFHIDRGFEGSFIVRPDGSDGGLEVEVRNTATDSSGAAGDAAIESILVRFERYYAGSCARAVYEGLLAAGWSAFAPEPRVGSEPSTPYIRMVYPGSVESVTLFMNSKAVVVGGNAAQSFAATLPTVTMRQTPYFYHQGGNAVLVLSAAAQMVEWADGRLAA